MNLDTLSARAGRRQFQWRLRRKFRGQNFPRASAASGRSARRDPGEIPTKTNTSARQISRPSADRPGNAHGDSAASMTAPGGSPSPGATLPTAPGHF
ncbi:MAG: hypothetical protein KGL39_47740 [Patescibacteria group bacterium]|nr:hypothetical protein [Patescibacteria group bacterium]